MSIAGEEVATLVSNAKNTLSQRCGHSPAAWLFGREGRSLEAALDPEGYFGPERQGDSPGAQGRDRQVAQVQAEEEDASLRR